MLRASVWRCALLAGLTGTAAVGQCEEAAPYITQRTSLTIPFSVSTGQSDFKPTEVQVYASYDRGQNWQFYSRHRPEEGEFLFRTKRDGEYWFATRTLDAQRRSFPDGNLLPQLKVVVDTTPPALELQAEVQTTGDVSLAWQMRDEWLEVNSLKLSYQGAALQGQGDWQDIPLEYAGKKQDNQFVGHTVWVPRTSQRVINLRAQVKDKAGNTTVIARQVFMPRNVQPPKPLANNTPSAGNANPATNSAPNPNEMLPPVPANVGERTPLATTQPQNQWNSLAGSPNGTSSQPDDQVASKPAIGSAPGDVQWPVTPQNNPSPQPEVVANTLRGQGYGSANANPSYGTPAPESATGPGRLASTDGLAGRNSLQPGYPLDVDNLPFNTSPVPPSAVGGANDNNPPPTAAPVVPASPQATENWLATERPRLTKSHRFSLDYEVDSVAPENLGDVELWGTSDGGRTWLKWGSDNDRTSPFEVEVSSEAIYGFRIVIVARNGIATRPPQAGDSADIWIQVDSTPPAARLTQAAYGQGDRAGQLDIRWEATDTQLAERPITLSFADNPQGPFTTIAAGLPNNGQFWWAFDPRSPRQIYLRLEAKDAAGNVAVYNLPEPISAEGLIPRGRIKSLSTPTDAAGQQAFRAEQFR